MSEWNVVLVVSTLVGMFLAVGLPALRLAAQLTTIGNKLDDLSQHFAEHKTKYEQEHEKLVEENRREHTVFCADIGRLRQEGKAMGQRIGALEIRRVAGAGR